MRVLYVVLTLALLLTPLGCSLNSQFVDAVDGAWSVIGPEYTAYVQADPALDADTKATRIRTAQLLTETIAEAQK